MRSVPCQQVAFWIEANSRLNGDAAWTKYDMDHMEPKLGPSGRRVRTLTAAEKLALSRTHSTGQSKITSELAAAAKSRRKRKRDDSDEEVDLSKGARHFRKPALLIEFHVMLL